MMEGKTRKTINISLQSKKYGPQMNELINKWEQDGDNISFKICEMLLKFENLQQSATFLKVLNLFELTEKMATVYNLNDKEKMEEILSKVIQIDNASLSEIFMTLNQFQDVVQDNKKNIDVQPTQLTEVKEVKPQKFTTVEKVEQQPKIVKEETTIEETTEDCFDIPMDFLMNG